jgi:hypothetical protein
LTDDAALPVGFGDLVHQSQQIWEEYKLNTVDLISAIAINAPSLRLKAMPMEADSGVMTAKDKRTQFMIPPSKEGLCFERLYESGKHGATKLG